MGGAYPDRMNRAKKIVFLSLLLSACAVTHAGVLVEEYGDSTTQGWQVVAGRGRVTPNSAPLQLQRKLQTAFGPSVVVSNQGVGGTEASQLWDGTDGLHPKWPIQMKKSRAQVVTLNFGLNDAYWISVHRDGTKAETPDDFAGYLTKLVTTARRCGKQVVLYEPNPTTEPVRSTRLPSYVAALRRVARNLHVPIVKNYDAIRSIPNWPELLSDGLHPSDQLYGMKADAGYAVLKPMVADALRSQGIASKDEAERHTDAP